MPEPEIEDFTISVGGSKIVGEKPSDSIDITFTPNFRMPGVTDGVVLYLQFRPATPPTPPTVPFHPNGGDHNFYDRFTPFVSDWDLEAITFTSSNPDGTVTFDDPLTAVGDPYYGVVQVWDDGARLEMLENEYPSDYPYAWAGDACTLSIPFSSDDDDIRAWGFAGGVQVQFSMRIQDSGAADTNFTTATAWETFFSISEATGAASGAASGAACFLGPTKVKTDQGLIAFNQLTKYNTISNLKIKKVIKMYNSDDNLIFIKKHAFGKNIPNKNTYIGRNHAIYIDGKLVRARNLINKKSVQQHARPVNDMIYNVLLEKYGVMYINNMPCETLNENDPAMLKYIK